MPGGSCGNLTAALAPKFPRSTKPALLFCDLSRRTAQHRSFPAPWSVYSHPLQNRVPRVQVLLPLPQNRRKLWASAGFLFACVAWFWGSFWFGHGVFSSGLTRSQPFPSPPAPKTHPVLPFWGFSGRVFLFFAGSRAQNFRVAFCASCHIVVTD